MCGLAGIVTRGAPVGGDPRRLAETLSRSLAHRGPDGDGCWLSPSADVLLVHRRLAIIDPTPHGAQPMATPDRRARIVFNGEIYNHRELRRILEARGESFETESDTDVLLRLIALDGPDALARVRGMFALACWNAAERTLLVARDRFGIKPLYVAATPQRIAFASELRALRAGGLLGDGLSPSAVLAYLSWGSVPPPLALDRGAEALAPGTWRRWTLEGGDDRGTFADTRFAYNSSGSHRAGDEEFRARVHDAVHDSVRAHLVADVPVGVFLSGGIDSTAIVSAAAAVGARDLQTFTVGFDHGSSEADAARHVAGVFGTRHHDIHVDAAGVVRDFPAFLSHVDQPTIDGVNSFIIAKAVAATGIKAVLSGTGGDELFGGYPSFRRLPRAIAIRRASRPAWPLIAPVAEALMPERLRARWRLFAAGRGRLTDAYRVQRGFLMPEEIAALAGPALRDDAVWREASAQVEAAERARLDPAGAPGDEQPLAGVARLESRMYLTSQLLRDIDVMAMAHGLEVRVPFVDHKLLGSVWPELGFHPALLARKRLLRETIDRSLPAGIARRPKQGFTLPFASWMGGEFAPLVQDGMRQLADRGWIAPDAPDRVWTAWRSHTVHWSRPWGLAILGHGLGR
jgi:asparagine synthase (glutamine-hydrolysing)